MNNYEKELKDKWERVTYHQGGSIQLNVSHPLEWYVGYFSDDAKSIIIVSDAPVSKIDSSKSIQASCNPRKDGRYATSLTLTSKEQEDVFITMCGDMISYSSTAADGKRALALLLLRYNAWLKLLQHKTSALLSANEQKGLLGELLYLKEKIESGLSPSDALAGWVGPDGADQDFVYEDGWHEIKTTGVSSAKVTISSVEQLDCDPPGELIVMRVDKCAPAHAGAFTLRGLIHQIMNLITSNIGTADDFVLKLGSVGYIDMPEYDQQNFVFSSRQIYAVEDSFPRITRKDIPTEIVNLKYTLGIPGLSSWQK